MIRLVHVFEQSEIRQIRHQQYYFSICKQKKNEFWIQLKKRQQADSATWVQNFFQPQFNLQEGIQAL